MRGSVGTLDVTVVEGVDLQAKDLNNKSDPFCVVKLGEQQEQTTPVINNNLNPKWNYKACRPCVCAHVCMYLCVFS